MTLDEVVDTFQAAKAFARQQKKPKQRIKPSEHHSPCAGPCGHQWCAGYNAGYSDGHSDGEREVTR